MDVSNARIGIEKKTIWLDILLTFLTFGVWNLWVQVRQISDINTVANKKVIPHFLWILFLSIITLGIYFAYHEYKMTKEIHLRFYGESFPMMEVLLALLTFMALWFVVDTYQQYILNQIAEGKKVVRPPLLFSFFY